MWCQQRLDRTEMKGSHITLDSSDKAWYVYSGVCQQNKLSLPLESGYLKQRLRENSGPGGILATNTVSSHTWLHTSILVSYVIPDMNQWLTHYMWHTCSWVAHHAHVHYTEDVIFYYTLKVAMVKLPKLKILSRSTSVSVPQGQFVNGENVDEIHR